MPNTRNTPKTVSPFEQIRNKLINIEAAIQLNCIHLQITAFRRSITRFPMSEALKTIDVLNDELIIAGFDEEKRILESWI